MSTGNSYLFVIVADRILYTNSKSKHCLKYELPNMILIHFGSSEDVMIGFLDAVMNLLELSCTAKSRTKISQQRCTTFKSKSLVFTNRLWSNSVNCCYFNKVHGFSSQIHRPLCRWRTAYHRRPTCYIWPLKTHVTLCNSFTRSPRWRTDLSAMSPQGQGGCLFHCNHL